MVHVLEVSVVNIGAQKKIVRKIRNQIHNCPNEADNIENLVISENFRRFEDFLLNNIEENANGVLVF